MKNKCLLLLLAASVGCSVGTSGKVASRLGSSNPGREAGMSVRQEQVDTSRAAILVQRLQDSDEGTRERAKKDIALFAKESEQSREQVIRELIKLMESSDVRLRLSSPTHYDAWTFAAGYLGEIKATEAIDALVSCIDCNNGVAGLSRLPAYKAIVMIGPQAVAKLTDALDHGRPEARQYSALALGEIGGAEAKKALGDALQQEEDKEVITCIKMALSRL